MSIFELHQAVVDDYQSYAKSFLNIADDRIRELVETELLENNGICPEALVQLSPVLLAGPQPACALQAGPAATGATACRPRRLLRPPVRPDSLVAPLYPQPKRRPLRTRTTPATQLPRK